MNNLLFLNFIFVNFQREKYKNYFFDSEKMDFEIRKNIEILLEGKNMYKTLRPDFVDEIMIEGKQQIYTFYSDLYKEAFNMHIEGKTKQKNFFVLIKLMLVILNFQGKNM